MAKRKKAKKVVKRAKSATKKLKKAKTGHAEISWDFSLGGKKAAE